MFGAGSECGAANLRDFGGKWATGFRKINGGNQSQRRPRGVGRLHDLPRDRRDGVGAEFCSPVCEFCSQKGWPAAGSVGRKLIADKQ